MKKLDVSKSSGKKLKYGGYATVTTAVVLAILLIVNLMAGKLNLKADLTQNKMYSLSEQTFQVLDALNKDVKILIFAEAGKEDVTTKSIVEKYTARSKKITIDYRDAVKYPQFAKKYSQGDADVTNGCIVVEAGSKFKLIESYDLVNYSYDEYGQSSADSLAIEQRVTGAIMYVTSDKNPVILGLQGHEEASLPVDLSKALENQNYTIKDFNLLQKDVKMDETQDILLVNSPKKDLSADEANKVKDFLAKGGKALFFMDIVDADMPNFQAVLNAYGVGLQKAVVVEGDPNYSTNNPIYLLPQMASHDIVSPLSSKDVPVIIPGAQGIEQLNIKKRTTTVEPLLTTSKNSWGKKNLQATTAQKEADDIAGPFNVAVAITDKLDDFGEKNTKIVLVSNGLFASGQFAASGANTDFVVNSFNWAQDRKDAISISPKSLATGRLTMNVLEQLVFAGIVVILIPALIMIRGIMVWLRRRHQ